MFVARVWKIFRSLSDIHTAKWLLVISIKLRGKFRVTAVLSNPKYPKYKTLHFDILSFSKRQIVVFMKFLSLIKFSKTFSNWDWLVWNQTGAGTRVGTGYHTGYHTVYYTGECPGLTIRNKSIWKHISVLNVYKLELRSERMGRECLWHNCKEGNNSRILFILFKNFRMYENWGIVSWNDRYSSNKKVDQFLGYQWRSNRTDWISHWLGNQNGASHQCIESLQCSTPHQCSTSMKHVISYIIYFF